MSSVAESEACARPVRDLPVRSARAEAAWCDLVGGAVRGWMWTALAVQDIKLRYRGSVLGPFWLTISTIVMVASIGVIYSQLFGMKLDSYLPYLTIGLIVWQFVSSVITEGCDTFLGAAGVIQQVPLPFSIHAYRNVCRNLLVLAHSLVIIPVVLFLFPKNVDWRVVESFAGLALLTFNGLWISILLGMVSTRFRDIPPIIANFLQVLFFMTPVFWPLEAVGEWKNVLSLNPAFAVIDVIRAPLMGQPVMPSSWIILLAGTFVGAAGTFAFFARFRTRIAFWI